VDGLTVRSPESDVSIPDSLSGMVSGVVGLDDSAQFVVTDHTPGATNAPPPAAFVNAPPCSTYWGQAQATGFTNPYGKGTLPYAPCGSTPAQVKGAYGLRQTPYDGPGQTVAIIDAYASPTIAADANQWSANRGLPQFKANQFTQVVAPGTYHHPESGGKNKQDPQGWYGEETLDVEAVHGMAPGANIVYIGAPNNNYLFETGWGTKKSTWTGTAWSPAAPGNWVYGAGGGVSTLFAEPSYRQGVVPASVFTAQGRTGRAVPDIAAIADPNTGYLIGETQTFPDGTAKCSEYRIGGTSLASPIVAGIMALANQAAGHPLGFVNPLLYSLAGSSSFRDVTNPPSTVAMVRVDYNNSVDASAGTTTSLRTANQTLSLATTPGWDDVTGLGTPTAALLSALAG
jgi:subtilase family serine protease